MFRSVVSRLQIFNAVAIVLGFACLLFIVYGKFEQSRSDEFKDQSMLFTQFISGQINTGTRLKRGAMIEPQIQAVLSNEGLAIAGLRVTHVENVEVLSRLKENLGGRDAPTFKAADFESGADSTKAGDWLIARTPITLGVGDAKQTVGELAIAWDTVPMHSELTASLQELVWGFAVVVGAAVLLLAGVAYWQIARPLKQLVNITSEVADGKEAKLNRLTSTAIEFRSMSGALEIFQANAEARSKLEAEQLERHQSVERSIADFGERSGSSMTNIQSDLNSFVTLAEEFRSTSETVHDESSKTVSQAVRTVSDATQSVAAATEEMVTSLKSVSDIVSQSTVASQRAQDATHGSRETLEDLAEQVENINQFVDLVQDIAEQTNLLALNATIESARAGEAGRGFAVVASEVKNLANQVTNATASITTKIEQLRVSFDRTQTHMQNVGEAIDEVQTVSSSVSSSVEEQLATTHEIGRSIDLVACQISDVASQVDQASERIVTLRSSLEANTTAFNESTETFLQQVRS